MEDGSDDGREVKKNRKLVSVGVEAQRKRDLEEFTAHQKAGK